MGPMAQRCAFPCPHARNNCMQSSHARQSFTRPYGPPLEPVHSTQKALQWHTEQLEKEDRMLWPLKAQILKS